MARLLTGLALVAALAACAPAERTATVDDRPALEILNAVFGSRLFVDGLDMGMVGDWFFDHPLLLEPGTHQIKVVGPNGGSYSEKVFLSGRGTRAVTVPTGAAP